MREKTYIIVLLLIGSVTCDMKTWTKNTNYDDPNNWSSGGLACSNDIKKFPRDMKTSVFIQKNESLQELLLSDNMVLTIDEGVVLTFVSTLPDSERPKVKPSADPRDSGSVSQQTTPPTDDGSEPAECDPRGRVVEFNASASSWFAAGSWKTNQIHGNDSLRFLLDMEKIPCSQDRTVFPSANSFLVDMEARQLSIGSMLVHNEEMINQAGFDQYWIGAKSPYEFMNRPSSGPPVVSGLPCGDDRSCQCSDRYTDDMKSTVCAHVTCPDVSLLCDQPLPSPQGHCCQICGATITVSTNYTDDKFPIHDLHNTVLAALHTVSDVKYTIGRLTGGSVDIILIDSDDDGNGKKASDRVCLITKQLQTNESIALLEIANVTFNRSDGVDNCNPPLPPARTTPHTGKKINPAKWDTIIISVSLAFGVVCLLLVFLGVYLYRKRYSVPGKNELELGRVNRTSQGFDNPVYDTPLPFEDNFVVSYDPSDDQVHGFENALYTPESGGDNVKTTAIHEKKTPIEDPYAPVVKKSKKSKKQKQAKNLGFDNPVYSANSNGTGEKTDSMVSVPLDEEDSELPGYVEHDGDGFVNPIATGLSEEMMAPSLPKKTPLTGTESKGFDNPLFGGEGGGSDVAQVTVHAASGKPKKKKKQKKSAAAAEGGASEELGFGNPMYGQDDEPQDFYQPETPGEDHSDPTPP